jgi:hypothetical protein
LGYWIGVLVIVAGIGGGAYLSVRGVMKLTSHFGQGPSVTVPAREVIELPSGGEHTIMVSLESGRNLSTDDPGLRALANAVQVDVFTADGNEPIRTSAGMDMNYQWPGKAGFSIGNVDVRGNRRVKVHARIVEDMLPADGQLLSRMNVVKVHLVQMNVMGAIGGFLMGGALVVGGIVLGVVIIIVTAVRRSKNKPAVVPRSGPFGTPQGHSPPSVPRQSPPPPPPGQG